MDRLRPDQKGAWRHDGTQEPVIELGVEGKIRCTLGAGAGFQMKVRAVGAAVLDRLLGRCIGTAARAGRELVAHATIAVPAQVPRRQAES